MSAAAEHPGTEIVARLLAAGEARQLASDLDRRGGGFTSHAAALCRQRADDWEREAGWRIDALCEGVRT